MNEIRGEPHATPLDSGLAALCAVANFHRLPADPVDLERQLNLRGRCSTPGELVRLSRLIGLKGKVVEIAGLSQIARAPTPALVILRDGSTAIYLGLTNKSCYRVLDPLLLTRRDLAPVEFELLAGRHLILLQRRSGDHAATTGNIGFAWVLASVWRYRRPLCQVILASLFIQILTLLSPLLFQMVMDRVFWNRASSTLVLITVALLTTMAFEVVLRFLRSYALAHTANRIDVELGQRLFRHLLSLPLSYFETRPAGQTAARLRELESIRSFLTGQALFCTLDVFFATSSLAILFFYSTRLAMIVAVMLPVYFLIGAFVTPSLRARMQERFSSGALAQQFLLESIAGIQTLKSIGVESDIHMLWEERLATYVRTSFRTAILAISGQTAVQLTSRISSAALLFTGVEAAMDGQLTIGQLVAFNLIAGQVAQPVLRLSYAWQDFQQARVSVERLNDILTTEPEGDTTIYAPSSRPHGSIEFCNVTFRYQPGLPFVLREFSMKINAGDVVGIVGPSGSGKSSIARLIQRLHLPSDGRILIDETDIAHLDLAWVRRGIGVVFQEPLLFNRTILENIAISNPAMSRRSVIHAARLSGADEFISRLPHGYETIIEERGCNLSGGQRQRIAIARAIAAEPSVLILDEATSELDFEGEQKIRTNLRKIAEGRTVIVIAHRLSMVRNCDRIFAIVDGRMIESGTHQELMRLNGGVYARLWQRQFDDGIGGVT